MDETLNDSVEMDDVTSAFFSNLTGVELDKEEEDTDAPAAAEGEETETPAEPAGDEKPAEGEEKSDDPDDAEVEIKDGETTSKAKLRDLKAAFQARAATEKATAEAAELRQRAEFEASRAQTALTALVDKAKARWEPFSKIDWLSLSKDPNVDQESFNALRAEAQAALGDVQFLTKELDGANQARTEAASKAAAAEAQATVKELSDPVNGIPGFNQQLYGEMLQFAVEKIGAPREAAQRLTAPWAFRVLHKAMMYDRSQATAAAAKEKVEKAVAKPTKVLKPTGTNTASKAGGSKQADVIKAMREAGGSVDAAADAFFALSRVDD